jgi:lysophospholipase L1-like esterase
LGGITITQQYALINLGVNSIQDQTETPTKTFYQYIIDAINTKWPLCKIYITKPWARGSDSYADTLAGWIDDLITANPGVAYLADDERGWYKGADNGATMTSDGIHPSAAGNAEKINQMVTVLGY